MAYSDRTCTVIAPGTTEASGPVRLPGPARTVQRPGGAPASEDAQEGDRAARAAMARVVGSPLVGDAVFCGTSLN